MTDKKDEKGGEEFRIARRRRTLKSGRLFFTSDHAAIDCLVRDMSVTGAKLIFKSWFDCPEELTLQIWDEKMEEHNIRCRKVWQDGTAVGVTFDKANDNLPPITF